MVDTPDSQAFTYTHNAAGQIKARTASNDAYAWTGHFNINRSYTANGLNQLITAGGLTLTYDTRGNLTSDGVSSYGYDVENRLVSGPGGATLAYDPAGRLSQAVGTATARFLYDGQDVIGEYDAAGVLQERYVHGPGMDEPLVWYVGSTTNQRRWYAADERGSVIATTNAAGAANKVFAYDEYGLLAGDSGGRFRFTGQMWLHEAGVYHYKARAYSPALGRFMQTDPIGYDGGMNLYAYVGNDPVNLVDPFGLTKTLRCTVEDYGAGITGNCIWVELVDANNLRRGLEGVGRRPVERAERPSPVPRTPTNCQRSPSPPSPLELAGFVSRSLDATGTGAAMAAALNRSPLVRGGARVASSTAKFTSGLGLAYAGAYEVTRIQYDRSAGVSTEAAVAASAGRIGTTAAGAAIGALMFGKQGAMGGSVGGVPGATAGGAAGSAFGLFVGAFVTDYTGAADAGGMLAQEVFLRVSGCN